MGLWRGLLVDLLNKIDDYLGMPDDKIRFRCVCTDWRSTLLDLWDTQPPMLLIPYKNGSMCALYHPFEKKMLNIDLPEAREKVFKGSGHGWVVTVQLDGSINVVNPLSRAVVPLPHIKDFPDVLEYRDDEYVIENEPSSSDDENAPPYRTVGSNMVMRNYHVIKIVLSCSPTCKDFRAVARTDYRKLAYCKVGDNKWRDLVDVRDCRCEDVTFVGAKLYVLAHNNEGQGEIYVCDNIVSCPELRKCVTLPIFEVMWGYNKDHLINSTYNGLAIVRRNIGHRHYVQRDGGYHEVESSNYDDSGPRELISFTSGFEIFKPDMSSSSWVSVKSLGDEILFMGLGTEIGISSKKFRGSSGNQIYFATDDLNYDAEEDVEDCFDNGVFNFGDKEIKPLDYECNSKVIWPQPIWFTPNPY